MSSNPYPLGQLEPWSTWNQFSNINFIVTQAIAKLQTATLVKVISCTNSGGLSPVGTVNIQPLVDQVDADGNSWPHTTIYNVPYLRIQSSNGNAIIMDPAPGDIGIGLFASRDISKVKSTQASALPGSARSYDFSDAMYVGGMLGQSAPTQYVQFSPNGITIVSPTAITLQAPVINLEGAVMQTNGTMTAQTDVLAGSEMISLTQHLHTSEGPGNPTSPPLP